MKKKSVISRILAITGTVLVWLPILFMIFTGVIGSIERDRLMVDYLIPAELFPAVGIGGILLIIAAVMVRTQRKWIIWSFVVIILTLVGSQALAVVTGLASGRTEPTGIWWILVLALLVVYIIAVIALGVGGILLIKKIFTKNPAEDSIP